jgi:protein-tyrosine phosphatase
VASATRTLTWDGCANVRDLGGLTTVDGGSTRSGAIVRSDNARRLSDAGWEALVAHGIRTVVDLRTDEERAADPPREVSIDVVHLSLFGEEDTEYLEQLGRRLRDLPPTDQVREFYVHSLDRFRANLVAAVRAVADAGAGGVLIHCAAGKDRTGLVAALLLRLAGVGPEDVAADYAESEANLAELTALWAAEAPDEEERLRRVQLSRTPREAMLGVLEQLDRRHGGVREYLLAGGATEAELDRAVARLR